MTSIIVLFVLGIVNIFCGTEMYCAGNYKTSIFNWSVAAMNLTEAFCFLLFYLNILAFQH